MISAEPHVVNVKSMRDRWRLWLVGDLHLYNRSCVESEIDAMIEEIKNDACALWIGMGDMADCIDPYDPRFDAREVAPDKRENFFQFLGRSVVRDLVEKFKPIRKKCVGLHSGNHESKYEAKTDQAIVSDVCENLGVRYLGYSSIFDLVFRCRGRSESFKVWCHHGAGGATTTGGKINKLKKAMVEVADADIYCMAHMHEQLDLSLVNVFQDEHGKLQQRKRLGVVTGAYLATYKDGSCSYGEKKLYAPVSLGSVAVTIVPETRRLGIQKM